MCKERAGGHEDDMVQMPIIDFLLNTRQLIGQCCKYCQSSADA